MRTYLGSQPTLSGELVEIKSTMVSRENQLSVWNGPSGEQVRQRQAWTATVWGLAPPAFGGVLRRVLAIASAQCEAGM
jgi:hypothetical protein